MQGTRREDNMGTKSQERRGFGCKTDPGQDRARGATPLGTRAIRQVPPLTPSPEARPQQAELCSPDKRWAGASQSSEGLTHTEGGMSPTQLDLLKSGQVWVLRAPAKAHTGDTHNPRWRSSVTACNPASQEAVVTAPGLGSLPPISGTSSWLQAAVGLE